MGRLPAGTDLSDWTHVAIRVQTRGLAATHLRELRRVGIFGGVVGTHAWVRNLTGWAEPRYR